MTDATGDTRDPGDETEKAGDDTEETGELVAVYGTLMRGFENHNRAGMDRLDFLCDCVIPGLLYDLGEFPGLVLADGGRGAGTIGSNTVPGELYRARSVDLDRLDRFEGAVGDDPRYVRRRVKLLEPSRTAWVYEYAHRVENATVVESGNWREYSR